MAIHNDDSHFAEQFPLSAMDDFMVYQTPEPVRVVATSDPRFFERYWCVLHDDTGELMLALGGSFYPNLDRCEAYAIVTFRGEQRSVRAFRPLSADRTNVEVGPIRHEILRGMREWRFHVEDNPWGVSLDLHWTDTRRQVYHAAWSPLSSGKPAGRQRDVTADFEGFGVAHGRVTFGGDTIDIAPGTFHGTRDRHWGVGRGVGGPNLQFGKVHKADWIGGNWINFRDFAIWGNTVLYPFGDIRPGMGKVRHAERRLRFEEDTKIFTDGEIDYTLSDGSVKRVTFRRLGNQTAYMRCGMYGGTPEGNIHQGAYPGGERVEGDRYDLGDPAVRRKLSALNEHHCEISCDGEVTTGILQPLEPDAYEACAQGKPGWRFL